MSIFTAAARADPDTRAALDSVAHLSDYPVVELRRYDIAPGQRDHFVRYFDAYFPEAFEQLDCMVFVKKGNEEAFAQRAQAAFARYESSKVHPAGVLVTLDVPNNFPQLPIRTDGPFLVWLGVVENDAALERFESLAAQVEHSLERTGMLRGAPERLVLDPTPRSRLRWWPSDAGSAP